MLMSSTPSKKVSTHSMEWHNNCLNNLKASLHRKEEELQRAKDAVSRIHDEVVFYEYQIQKAIKQGKDTFDPEKFGRTRSQPIE